jgi:hypothetical protein
VMYASELLDRAQELEGTVGADEAQTSELPDPRT